MCLAPLIDVVPGGAGGGDLLTAKHFVL